MGGKCHAYLIGFFLDILMNHLLDSFRISAVDILYWQSILPVCDFCVFTAGSLALFFLFWEYVGLFHKLKKNYII